MLQAYVTKHNSVKTPIIDTDITPVTAQSSITVINGNFIRAGESSHYIHGTMATAAGTIAMVTRADGAKLNPSTYRECVFSSSGAVIATGDPAAVGFLFRYEAPSLTAGISLLECEVQPIELRSQFAGTGDVAMTWEACCSFDCAPYTPGNQVWFGVGITGKAGYTSLQGYGSLRINFEERSPFQPLKN